MQVQRTRRFVSMLPSGSLLAIGATTALAETGSDASVSGRVSYQRILDSMKEVRDAQAKMTKVKRGRMNAAEGEDMPRPLRAGR